MKAALSTFVISLIRTIVPAIVGQVAGFFTAVNLPIGEDAKASLSVFLGLLLTAVYYSAVRLFEQKFPQVGIFLGVAKSPDSYSKGEASTDNNDSQEKIIPGTTLQDPDPTQGSPVHTDSPQHRA